eukprot:scaffold146176_cov14-Prasinocladus_malaysianus.AAC.1
MECRRGNWHDAGLLCASEQHRPEVDIHSISAARSRSNNCKPIICNCEGPQKDFKGRRFVVRGITQSMDHRLAGSMQQQHAW